MEEDWLSYGVGAELAASIQEGAFDYLDAPVRRVAMSEIPLPYAKPLEVTALQGRHACRDPRQHRSEGRIRIAVVPVGHFDRHLQRHAMNRRAVDWANESPQRCDGTNGTITRGAP